MPGNSPRLMVFNPTKLNMYKRCPAQYDFRYRQKLRSPSTFEPGLTLAIAVHDVIGRAFSEYRRSHTFPNNLERQLERQLPVGEYIDQSHLESEVQRANSLVNKAIVDFGREASIKAVERTYEYVCRGRADCPDFVLQAKVDLVLEHRDGVIEHIDWKTGSSNWHDAIQTLCSRIVVGNAFHGRTVRSTTVYLESGTVNSDVLEREAVVETWNEVKSIVRSIIEDDFWEPSSNPLCPSCAWYENGCSLYRVDDQVDAIADWLENPSAS